MSEQAVHEIDIGGFARAMALCDGQSLFALVRAADGQTNLAVTDLKTQIVIQGADCGIPDGTSRSRQLRITSDGTAWVTNGQELIGVDSKGQVTNRYPVKAEGGESVEGFLVLPDGFLTASIITSGKRNKSFNAKLARYTWDGHAVWSTLLPAGAIAYKGVVAMRRETGWQVEQKAAWKPEDWQPHYTEPMILSGNKLLASFFEKRSGIGCSYCLDASTGRVLWSTEPAPSSTVLTSGPGEFLIGTQGYGAFDMYRYDEQGKVSHHWPSHAYLVVTPEQRLVGVEMENRLPSAMAFCELIADGTVLRGPHLQGYHTTYPVLTASSEVVFWRNGVLRAIGPGPDFVTRVLWENRELSSTVWGPTLITDGGTIVFAAENKLISVPTDLRPAENSPWPCRGGNRGNNPVFFAEHL